MTCFACSTLLDRSTGVDILICIDTSLACCAPLAADVLSTEEAEATAALFKALSDPARVRTVCVDMNPSSVTKLSDRGTWQSTSLVTDVGYFLRELRTQLQRK